MFLTIHSSAGIFIGSQINNPLLALGLGFLSHLILDMIPHGDESLGESPELGPRGQAAKIKRLFLISSLDLLLVILLFNYLASQNLIIFTPSLLAGLLGSIVPDFIWGFHEITQDRLSGWLASNILSRIHDLLKVKVALPLGLVIQLTTLIIFTFLIIN